MSAIYDSTQDLQSSHMDHCLCTMLPKQYRDGARGMPVCAGERSDAIGKKKPSSLGPPP